MRDEQLPQWLVETGRSPAIKKTGRPVPPISGSATVAKEFDEAASVRLESDFKSVIDVCNQEDEYDLNTRVLDAMTGNRLSSRQAIRLLTQLFSKFESCQGMSRIDAAGDAVQMDRWGAA